MLIIFIPYISIGDVPRIMLTTCKRRSTVVHFLETFRPDSDVFVAHFFFSHSDRATLSAKSLFESFTKQILEYLTRLNKSCPGCLGTS
ncbi:hypothetical protein BJX63DRAFT_134425 [Aspergillus granulosus]|uniref:Uncharacterized protein n=1 Tax=Aspergillus granulosus TaxID=176169 RepID=A0ABR4HNB2_9EURO